MNPAAGALPSGGGLFLGLDGGQSHTAVLIGDGGGRVLGAGSAGPTNLGGSKDTHPQLEAAVEKALSRALQQAGLDGAARFTAACCGLSGGAEAAREPLSRRIDAARLEIVTDAQIALWGATGASPGIVVIAGTGSIAWGENHRGETARAGGWGYAFGDEGGAFDVVRQAVRAALKAEEGWGPETSLRRLLLEKSGASTMNEFLHRLYADRLPRDEIASLAPVVDRAAKEGDETAGEVLRGAGRELARLAQGVRRQLFAPGETVPIAYSGGVFRAVLTLDAFRARLTATGREPNTVIAPRLPPAHGALLRACRADGRKHV